ncbi:YkgJ family cysteine cluster protein [Desulfobaculum sp. SPO524]|uniref:YkgJ family cysteine cluster protein n=1 Tax=Desulfobaculum sp. SPO524 TaxID=3378071 RepID=UPI0038531909
MCDKERIFLTRDEAVEAMRIDFEQYAPQMALFADLAPRFLGGAARIVEHDGGIALRVDAAAGPRYIPADAAGECIWQAVERARLPLAELAALCHTVFWGRTEVAPGPDGEGDGIWMETGMERFACNECGLCCFTLDYRCSCTEEDRARWLAAGREDILEWVGDVLEDGEWLRDRLWVRPGTSLPAEQCPWMVTRPDGGYSCGIHDVKPQVCREYPGSVKHGALTGCYAFAPEQKRYRQREAVAHDDVETV